MSVHLLLCVGCAGAFVWSADLHHKDCSATEIAWLVLGEDHVLLYLHKDWIVINSELYDMYVYV